MGAYLSHPVTDKYSCEETLAHFSYGASSMQGWRATQEDAHNCIPNFDTNTTLFAVYDGHGGAEVAQYCAINLPGYIKSIPSYKAGNMAQALEDSFLGFDETLTRPEVISELKQMAGIFDQPSDAEENEVDELFSEANMPLEEVMAKYSTGVGVNPQLARLQGDKPQSPFLRAKQCLEEEEQLKKEKLALKKSQIKQADGDLEKCDETHSDSVTKIEMVNGDKPHTETNEDDGKNIGDGKSESASLGTKSKEKIDKPIFRNERDKTTVPGESVKDQTSNSTEKITASTSSSEAHPSCSTDITPGTRLGKRVSKSQGLTSMQDSDDSNNSEDENYEEGIPYADETDSEDEDNETEEKEDSDEDDDEEEEEEEEDSEDSVDEEEGEFGPTMPIPDKEEPGSDSGCTAVVALLRGNELYVANAGDSRCIVCRNGKAIDMSVDHKPEDEPEKKRIMNAGGKVTSDGRVNGGLNLSRAIGDHTYKQNESVAPRDQMISALPDIRTLTIDPEEDEFMVLACDGIWNYLSSQEVADFVKERINRGIDKLSLICEELFDHCLAPNTQGDGTGCDNMTAIIVRFDKGFGETKSVKRSLEETNGLEENSEVKRMKPREDGDTRTSSKD